MDNQKLDNELSQALVTSEDERAKSVDLNTGYLGNNRWELIIKYAGDIDRLKNLGISVTSLLGNYAIIEIDEELIDVISNEPEIIYIEKPKKLYFQIENTIRASCINSVQMELGLYGEGVIVAVIDSGIDYDNEVFINELGETRILEIWDQTQEGNPPEGYIRGNIYTRDEINSAIRNGNPLNTIDISGHGTAVASIAVGNFAENKMNNIGIATKSDILVVKLGNPISGETGIRDNISVGYPKTSELMQAIDYCIRRGVELNKPIVINLSFGNTYGSHDGTSLIEQYIDDVAGIGKTTIVIGTGNEGSTAGHYYEKIVPNTDSNVLLAVGEYEVALNLQIWKNYADSMIIEIITPDGRSTGRLGITGTSETYSFPRMDILVYYGEPLPFSVSQEIYIDVLPRNTYIDSGIYQIRIIPEEIKYGDIHMWLPAESSLNNTRFLNPNPDVTITSPATAIMAISVGAYDAYYGRYAEFSGRGYLRNNNIIKPDIVAPGVNIRAATNYGTDIFSGTSFATPVVAGAAAQLMEWGIVRGNDRYLYGEKVKAYLIKGARQLPGEETPSKKTGWGALCVADSIPR